MATRKIETSSNLKALNSKSYIPQLELTSVRYAYLEKFFLTKREWIMALQE